MGPHLFQFITVTNQFDQKNKYCLPAKWYRTFLNHQGAKYTKASRRLSAAPEPLCPLIGFIHLKIFNKQ